jgi:hypothetical protein
VISYDNATGLPTGRVSWDATTKETFAFGVDHSLHSGGGAFQLSFPSFPAIARSDVDGTLVDGVGASWATTGDDADVNVRVFLDQHLRVSGISAPGSSLLQSRGAPGVWHHSAAMAESSLTQTFRGLGVVGTDGLRRSVDLNATLATVDAVHDEFGAEWRFTYDAHARPTAVFRREQM